MSIRLEIRQSGAELRVVVPDRNAQFRVGSDPANDVVAQGEKVSPKHLAILWKGEEWRAYASKAAETIRVNGLFVETATLYPGDRIELGNVQISVLPLVDELTLAPLEEPRAERKPPTKPTKPAPSAKPTSSARPTTEKLRPSTAAPPTPANISPSKPPSQTPAVASKQQNASFATAPELDLAPETQKPGSTKAAKPSETKPSETKSTAAKSTKPAPKPADAFGLSSMARSGVDSLFDDEPAAVVTPAAKTKPAAAPTAKVQPLDEPPAIDQLSGVDLSKLDLFSAPAANPLEDASTSAHPKPKKGRATKKGFAAKKGKQKIPRATNLDDPLGIALDPPGDTSAPGGVSAAKTRRSLAKSPWLHASLVALVVIGFVTWGAIAWKNRPTEDDLLAVAETDYQAQAWPQAVQKFDNFLARYPRHDLANPARAHRAFAIWQPQVDAQDWPAAWKTAQDLVPEIRRSLRSDDDRQKLHDLLGRTVLAIMERALVDSAKPSAAALKQARQALALARKYVPPAAPAMESLSGVELKLARIELKSRQDEALRGVIKGLESGTRQALARALRLLREDPALAQDADLRPAIQSAARSIAAQVTYRELHQAARIDEPTTDVAATLAFARRASSTSVPPSTTSEVVLISQESTATLHALEASSGQLLWRRFVGFDSNISASVFGMPPNQAVLLVDSLNDELLRVDARTGRVAWHCSVGRCRAAPQIVGDRVLLSSMTGRLLEIDLASGETRGAFEFGSALRVPCAVASDGSRYYQMSQDGCLHVLAASNHVCTQVVALGDGDASSDPPPLTFGPFVLVSDFDGWKSTRWRLLRWVSEADGLAEVQFGVIDGQVASGLVHQSQVLLATSGGGLHAFKWDANREEGPLQPGPQRRQSSLSTIVPELRVQSGRLCIAAIGLEEHSLPLATDELPPTRRLQGKGFCTLAIGESSNLIVATHSAARSGCVVSAYSGTEPAIVWTSHLGASLAGPPLLDLARKRVTMLHPAGMLFDLSLDELDALANSHDRNAVRDASEWQVELPELFPADTRAIRWDDGLTVFAGGAGHAEILVHDPASTESRFRRLALPGAMACSPARAEEALLVPLELGEVLVLDPRSGRAIAEPFQPELSPGNLPRWGAVVSLGGGKVLLYDQRGRVHDLALEQSPSPRLIAKAVHDTTTRLVPPHTASGEVVLWGTDARGFLARDKGDTARPSSVFKSLGRLSWGPINLGARALVQSESGNLVCVDNAGAEVWTTKMKQGRPAGITMGDEGSRWLLVSDRGTLWEIDGQTGRLGTTWETLEPADGNLAITPHHYLIGTHDGAIHLLPRVKTP